MPRATDTTDDRERIAASELWKTLDDETVESLFEAGEILKLDTDACLFRPGEQYHKIVYLHLEGELEQTSSNGDVRIARTGDIIGLASYLDGDSYRSMARALSPCRLLGLPASEIRRLEHESTPFFEIINRALAARMRKASQAREAARGILARPVREFMRSTIATCTHETTITEACRIMEERRLDSLGIVNENGRLLGTVTPMTLLKAITEGGLGIGDSVGAADHGGTETVTPQTPLWRVEEFQRRRQLREIVITDDTDSPLGIITQTDLLEVLAKPPQTLDAEIRAADTIESLAALRQRCPIAARRVYESHRNVGMAILALTDMHLALQHRLIELILAGMHEEGYGHPPGRFAVIIMGSGGRGEMLLRPDQDNGLILDDDIDEDGFEWFEKFSERLNRELDRIGYRFCPGDVMARNPEYRQTLSGWCEKLSGLVREPGRLEARRANIVLDFATLYGNDNLTAKLRSHLNREIAEHDGSMLLRMMVSDDADINSPLGIFNRFRYDTYKGRQVIDLKKTGLRIIVDAMRVFALSEGCNQCKTSARITYLERQGIFDPAFIDAIRIAFEKLQDLLFTHQLEQAENGETPDPFIRIERLSNHDRERLRVSLRATQRMREHLQYTFGIVLHH